MTNAEWTSIQNVLQSAPVYLSGFSDTKFYQIWVCYQTQIFHYSAHHHKDQSCFLPLTEFRIFGCSFTEPRQTRQRDICVIDKHEYKPTTNSWSIRKLLMWKTNTSTDDVTFTAEALSTFSQSSVALSLEGMNRERTGAEWLSSLQERKSWLPEEEQLRDARAPKGGQSEFVSVHLSPRQKNMTTQKCFLRALEQTFGRSMENNMCFQIFVDQINF